MRRNLEMGRKKVDPDSEAPTGADPGYLQLVHQYLEAAIRLEIATKARYPIGRIFALDPTGELVRVDHYVLDSPELVAVRPVGDDRTLHRIVYAYKLLEEGRG